MALALRAHRAGALDDAAQIYGAILARAPDDADALHLLGVVDLQAGRVNSAVERLARAARDRPGNAVYQSRLGMAYDAAGQFDMAIDCYGLALAIDPTYAEAHNNLGAALFGRGEDQAAIESYRSALRQAPDLAEAHNNLGVALRESGLIEEAINCHRRALAVKPEYASAHKNLGIALLLKGEFGTGFDSYEWRWREPDSEILPSGLPAWHGVTESGQRLLIWGEQGVGDQLMFATLIKDLAAAGVDGTIACDPRLRSLFGMAFDSFNVVAKVPGQPPDQVTSFVPMGSLGRRLRRDRDAFGNGQAYLCADPERVAALRARYRGNTDTPLIGISWASRIHDQQPVRRRHAAAKSTALAAWRPILSQERLKLVNLQYGDCGAELAAAKRVCGTRLIDDQRVDQLRSLGDFAAQVAAMDLVVTTSNTTAHMAGALGVPCWTLLAPVPDWRWQMAGARSLWYPHMHLYRRAPHQGWCALLTEVGHDLSQLSVTDHIQFRQQLAHQFST